MSTDTSPPPAPVAGDEPVPDAIVVDGTADEVAAADAEVVAALAAQSAAATSTELAEYQPANGAMLVRAENPDDVLAKAGQIASSLKKLVEAQKLYADMGGGKKHIEVSAWQALGNMLGALGGTPIHSETDWSRIVRDPVTAEPLRTKYHVHVKRYYSKKQGGGLREEVEYDVDGYDWEARVSVKTPAGVSVGVAEAMCSRSEDTWSQRSDPALKSMAETRAESRAFRKAIGWIVHIAGYSPTPSEEMPPAGQGIGQNVELPSWARPLADQHKKAMLGLAEFLVSPINIGEPGPKTKTAAKETMIALAGQLDGMPEVAARVINMLATARDQLLLEATGRDPVKTAALADRLAVKALEVDPMAGETPPPDAGVPDDEPDPEDGPGDYDTRAAAAAPSPTPAPEAQAIKPELSAADKAKVGTVMVPLTNPDDPEQCVKEWRAAGCTCQDPRFDHLRDGSCVVMGHGIPF